MPVKNDTYAKIGAILFNAILNVILCKVKSFESASNLENSLFPTEVGLGNNLNNFHLQPEQCFYSTE